MQQIVFNIALLLPEEITDKIIKLNDTLRRNYTNKRIVLDKTTCLPHMTLLIGTFFDSNLMEIKKILDSIAQSFNPIDLEVDRFELEDLPAKNTTLKIAGLLIKKSEAINKLHQLVIEAIKPYLVDEPITKEVMYNPIEINPEDTPWMFPYIQNFIKNSSYDKFNPHITIGDGIIERLELPINFKAFRLVICHLGNYCTCRKILYETELRKVNIS